MAEHPRFRVHAYVAPGSTKEPSAEGWMLVGDIYTGMPDGHRYVVVEAVNGEFLVWDLGWLDGVRGKWAVDVPPDVLWRGPTADAMVMKALALYDRP